MSCAAEEGMHVVVEVPASTANLGPGFDTLGLALGLSNRYEFSLSPLGPAISITGEGACHLPRDEQHLGYRTCMNMLKRWGISPAGLRLCQHNRVPLAGGLGNSATAIVAGLMAANAFAGGLLSVQELLNEATAVEGHPDNVGPAIVGGLVVCSRNDDGSVNCIRMPVPKDLLAVVAVPDFAVNTRRAREALPSLVSLQDAVFNVSRVSLLLAALSTGRYDCLAKAMEDRLHQPYRASLIPGLHEVCRAALQAGAAGAALSGAGPIVVALMSERADPQRVGEAMTQAFQVAGVLSRYLVVAPSLEGATLQSVTANPHPSPQLAGS